MNDYGFLSLLPPLVAIVLAMLTRRVVISLLSGVLIGALLLAKWNPVVALQITATELLLPSLTSLNNIVLIVLFILVGGFVGLLERSGGAYALAQAVRHKATSSRRAQLIAWFSSIFIGAWTDASPVIVGPILRPIVDQAGVSRAKLAYIVDSTAAPMVVNVPFTSWAALIISILAVQIERLPEAINPWVIYFGSIPMNFYCFLAVLMVGIIALSKLDFGPMLAAESRVASSKMKIKEEPHFAGGVKPSLLNLVVPMALFFAVLIGYTLIGGGFPKRPLLEAIQEAEIVVSLLLAFLIGSIASGLVMILRRMAGLKQVLGYWLTGVRQVIFIIVIVVLAWSIGTLTQMLGTDTYLTSLLSENIPLFIVPALIFLIGAIISFATGTSWGVFSIMLPIAFGIGIALDLPLPLVTAATLSGGIFGDHCSPISDTTIMSSVGAGCNHIDHVNTQIVYALIVAFASFIAFLLAGLKLHPLLPWLAGIGIILAIMTIIWCIRRQRKQQSSIST